MSAVRFDTLKLAHRLQKAGLPQEQADAIAEALNETMGGDLASKADIAEIKAELTAGFRLVHWMIGIQWALTGGVLFLQLRGHV